MRHQGVAYGIVKQIGTGEQKENSEIRGQGVVVFPQEPEKQEHSEYQVTTAPH